jgi:hypothetical protein
MLGLITRLGGFGFLANPWALLIIAGVLASSHTYAYVQGRYDGAAKADLRCEVRVNRLEAAYEEQAKKIDEVNKAWTEALRLFVEGEAQRAKDRQAELDEANAKIEEYIAKLSDSKKACVLDDDDIASGLRNNKR